MSAILDLPMLALDGTTSANSDWRWSLPLGVNLADIDFKARVWERVPGHAVLLEASSDDGEIVGSGEMLTVNVDVAHMAQLDLGDWPLDILAFADGVVITLAVGTLTHAPVGGPIVTNFVMSDYPRDQEVEAE